MFCVKMKMCMLSVFYQCKAALYRYDSKKMYEKAYCQHKNFVLLRSLGSQFKKKNFKYQKVNKLCVLNNINIVKFYV